MNFGAAYSSLVCFGIAGVCAWSMLSDDSCGAAYRRRERAVPLEARVESHRLRTVTTTERDSKGRNITKQHEVADISVVAEWQGREVRRTLTEGVATDPRLRGSKIGETRRIYIDPQDPYADVAATPSFFHLMPAFLGVGAVIGGALLLRNAWRKVRT